jgi:flagellar protein FlaG
MSNHVARVASVTTAVVEPAAAVVQPRPEARNDNADAARLRLTIEATPEGRFIYKILDRVTGEVIRQLPREEVERLNADPTYRGGKVVDTAI